MSIDRDAIIHFRGEPFEKVPYVKTACGVYRYDWDIPIDGSPTKAVNCKRCRKTRMFKEARPHWK